MMEEYGWPDNFRKTDFTSDIDAVWKQWEDEDRQQWADEEHQQSLIAEGLKQVNVSGDDVDVSETV